MVHVFENLLLDDRGINCLSVMFTRFFQANKEKEASLIEILQRMKLILQPPSPETAQEVIEKNAFPSGA